MKTKLFIVLGLGAVLAGISPAVAGDSQDKKQTDGNPMLTKVSVPDSVNGQIIAYKAPLRGAPQVRSSTGNRKCRRSGEGTSLWP